MTAGWYSRPSTRKLTLPPDWEIRRLSRLRRDQFRCQHIRFDTGMKCGAKANQVDHVDDRSNHALENLQSLCEWHHQQKSSSQGGTAAARRRKVQKQKHPGII